MLDFVDIVVTKNRKGETVISPEFKIGYSKDLMIRGKSFYAIWDERVGLWSQNEADVEVIIDGYIREQYDSIKAINPTLDVTPLYLKNFSSKKWLEWTKYTKTSPDMFHQLDGKVIFANSEVTKEDYVTRRLDYPIKEGPHKCYDELIGTLYDKSERDKLEWAIGSIIAGDSKEIQKFIVMYGEAGTGKSTVIKIIEEMLFPGYCSTFNAKELTSSSNAFALEAFRNNPLIAFQPDGNLSRIEDNTKLNSLVSHETVLVNEKHKNQYPMRINTFLFIASNNPVKITEARSGLLRRLIDVSPTGNKIPRARYDALLAQIPFEVGAVAYHCLRKYQAMGKGYYDKYRPNSMMMATNDFYNFISDNYEFFSNPEGVSMNAAWQEYQKYATESGFQTKFTMRVFKEELKSYFTNFDERIGGRYKVYTGFKTDKFDYVVQKEAEKETSVDGCEYTLRLDQTESIFDKEFGECLAQLAKDNEKPNISWDGVKTKLKSIDTKKLHYVLVPENLIVLDFDLKDKDGNKDPVANLIAASKFPATYAEFSKSGGGIHLHYYYDGDVLKLSRIIEPGIEIKIFKKIDGTRGYATLRRKLSKCNDLPIAHINSGLPLKKGANDVVSFEGLKNEKQIRTLILRSLNKEHHGFTTPEVSLIYKTLENAYKDGITYDVTDLRTDILQFATKSHNQSKNCISLVSKMKFKSEDSHKAEPDSEYDRYFDAAKDENYISKTGDSSGENSTAPIVFFDVEVFPNLFVICWKFDGTPVEQTVRMINPSSEDVKKLFYYRLIGFNNRRYDNHILFAASQGYSNKNLYDISQGIINAEENSGKKYTFGAAYNLSYTDIYDFAAKKQSLKKWEIELGIHHQELGLPWDKEVSRELWDKVADYCVNDVVATEALFHNRKIDFETRELLASLSGLSVNDTNRAHITRILVGDNKKPEHVYTDLSTIFPGYEYVKGEDGRFHNMYRGVDVGFGGYVYAEPGMYTNVALLDVGNMHGASIIALNKFGEYTKNYSDIREARMAVKSGRFEDARKMLDGKLNRLLDEIESYPEGSEERAKAADGLQSALKLILNSTYGIAAATFDNPLRDKRDVNNIIALRGALFMKTLQDEVVKKGFKVVHVKTDSLKVPDATDAIIEFIIEFGRKYGYEFEHECTYERLCLVNDAVYVAKYDDKGVRNKHGKDAGKWTATGAQFKQSFVFKTLFSKEPIDHTDVCETKETSKGLGLYLDMSENLPEGEHDYRFVGKVGQFCPIKPNCGGGILVREKDGKFAAVTGTKKPTYDKKNGEEPIYRWLESEVVNELNKWADVDFSYYERLVDEAVSDISKYGDFEWFVSDTPVPPVDNSQLLPDFMNIPETDEEQIPYL